MTKWEYITVPVLVHATKQILDNLGEDGWELVQVVPGHEPGEPRRLLQAAAGMSTPEERLAELGLSRSRRSPSRSRRTSRRCAPATTSSPPASCRCATGELITTGKVGGEVSAEEAVECAQQCALNALAAVRAEVGDLSQVKRIVKVVVFVASTPDFTGQPGVANGASRAVRRGLRRRRPARAVAPSASPVLPLDAPVEVELIVEV